MPSQILWSERRCLSATLRSAARSGWMRIIGITAILLGTSGCLSFYTSPKCFFLDQGEGRPILSVHMYWKNSASLRVSYWQDGYVQTFFVDTLYCRRLDPEVHRQTMNELERLRVATHGGATIRDVFRNDVNRLIVYAQLGDETTQNTYVWWSSGSENQPAHLETLDDVFCALESDLSALRRVVKRYAPDFLAARGRELPCGVE